MQFCLKSVCISNTGKVRENNEDNFYFDNQILEKEHSGLVIPITKEFSGNRICFAVFDGMGGHANGQLASYLAANSFQKDCEQLNDMEEVSDSFFNDAIFHMNHVVYENAEQLHNNMGTTCVILGFSNELVYVCNVGDSRAYRFREGNLVQISMDHVETIPPFMKSFQRRKARLSQCIGMSPKEIVLEPYLAEGIIKEKDTFLICSDGLTDMVSEEEIENILLQQTDIKEQVTILLDTALKNGGRDNITIIAIQITEVQGIEPDEEERTI